MADNIDLPYEILKDIFNGFRSLTSELTVKFYDLETALSTIALSGLTAMDRLSEYLSEDRSALPEDRGKRSLTIHIVTSQIEPHTRRIASEGAYPVRHSHGEIFSIDRGLVGEVVKTKSPLYEPDVIAGEYKEKYNRVVPETKSELLVPIIAHGVVLGVLNAESDKYRDFIDPENNKLVESRYVKILQYFADFCLLAFSFDHQKTLLRDFSNTLEQALNNDKEYIDIFRRNVDIFRRNIKFTLECLKDETNASLVCLILGKLDSNGKLSAWPFASAGGGKEISKLFSQDMENLFNHNTPWVCEAITESSYRIQEKGRSKLADLVNKRQPANKDIYIDKCYNFSVPLGRVVHGLNGVILVLSQNLVPSQNLNQVQADKYSRLLEKMFYNLSSQRQAWIDALQPDLNHQFEVMSEEVGERDEDFLRKAVDEIKTRLQLKECSIYYTFYKYTNKGGDGSIEPWLYPIAYTGNEFEHRIMGTPLQGDRNIRQDFVARLYNSKDKKRTVAFITGSAVDQRTIMDDINIFPEPIEKSVKEAISEALGRVLLSRWSQRVNKHQQEILRILAENLHELSLCESEGELYKTLHEIIRKILPLDNDFFCIYKAQSKSLEPRITASTQPPDQLVVSDVSQEFLRMKLRERGSPDSGEFPKFERGQGLTGTLLTSKGSIYISMMEKATGDRNCVRFWDSVVVDKMRVFYGRAFCLNEQTAGVITYNGRRLRTFQEDVFFEVIDPVFELLCQRTEAELKRILKKKM